MVENSENFRKKMYEKEMQNLPGGSSLAQKLNLKLYLRR